MSLGSRILLVLFVLLLALPAQAQSAGQKVADTGVLRCGYIVWPPYYDKDPNTGKVFGLGRDMVDAMMAPLGIKVEYVQEVAMGSQVPDLAADKYDAVCWDAPFMPSAAKFLSYSKPWFHMPVYAYANADLGIGSEEALNKPEITFSGLDGDLSQELVQRLFPLAKLQSIPATADPALITQNVVSGKSQAVINDPLSNDKFVAANGAKIVRVSQKPLAVYPMGFSMRPGEVQLEKLLDQAIDIYINTGGYEKLMQKYDAGNEYFIRVARPAFDKQP